MSLEREIFFLPKHDAKTKAAHNLVNFLFHLPNWVSGSHAETRLRRCQLILVPESLLESWLRVEHSYSRMEDSMQDFSNRWTVWGVSCIMRGDVELVFNFCLD